MWNHVDKEQLERDEHAHAGPSSPEEIEQLVVMVRLESYNRGLPCGAAVLHGLMQDHYNARPLPSVRKIGQILTGHCLTNARTGWYENESRGGMPTTVGASRPATPKRGECQS
jgi:hypothetical protein